MTVIEGMEGSEGHGDLVFRQPGFLGENVTCLDVDKVMGDTPRRFLMRFCETKNGMVKSFKNVSELSVIPLLEGKCFDCFFVFFSKGIPSEIIAVTSFPIGSWNMMEFLL